MDVGGPHPGSTPRCRHCGTACASAAAYLPANDVALTIQFPGVWIVVDAAVHVLVDGAELGVGSGKDGFCLKAATSVGSHTLELKMPLRRQRFNIDFPDPGVYEVRLSYSRFWGRFRRPTPVRVSAPTAATGTSAQELPRVGGTVAQRQTGLAGREVPQTSTRSDSPAPKVLEELGKQMLHDAIFCSARPDGQATILGHLDRIYALGGATAVRSTADMVLVTLNVSGAADKMEFMFQCCRAWANRDPDTRYDVFGYSRGG